MWFVVPSGTVSETGRAVSKGQQLTVAPYPKREHGFRDLRGREFQDSFERDSERGLRKGGVPTSVRGRGVQRLPGGGCVHGWEVPGSRARFLVGSHMLRAPGRLPLESRQIILRTCQHWVCRVSGLSSR